MENEDVDIDDTEDLDTIDEMGDEAQEPADSSSPEVELSANDTIIEQLRPRAPVNKPDISGLRNALSSDGLPLFIVGDRIVIERYAGKMLAGSPYIDTRTYRVVSIDMATGNTWLYDDALGQSAGTNWRTAPNAGDVFKFAPGRGSIATKRRRGRPAKAPPTEAPPSQLGLTGEPVKRKRGRPPGSKNKPKDANTGSTV